MNLTDKRKACMGAVDERYLTRYGELPFDTLERLQEGGFSYEESFQIMDKNMRIVSELLVTELEENENLKKSRLFLECPFCNAT